MLEQRGQVGVAMAEEALEATESSNATPAEEGQAGIYTEHVFTDPLGVQNNRDTTSSYTQRCFPLLSVQTFKMKNIKLHVKLEACCFPAE